MVPRAEGEGEKGGKGGGTIGRRREEVSNNIEERRESTDNTWKPAAVITAMLITSRLVRDTNPT